MPELPEVETIARGLRDLLRGKRIRSISVAWPRTVDGRSLAIGSLVGRRIDDVGRVGKFVAIALDDQRTLTVHLRMTGSLRVEPVKTPPDRHERLAVEFHDGSSLRFVDPRKFGRIRLLEGDAAGVLEIGYDPFDRTLDERTFTALLAGRRTPVKAWLLDQRRLSGVGNIYACEALFYAGIKPRRQAGRLTAAERIGLLRSLRRVLRRAIKHRGSSLNDYVDAEGKEGGFQKQFAVYGRFGLPCKQCRTPVRRIVLAQRSTFYCSACQR
ncbi:MAG TPA: bifunctional DNA-formamidopyrimidine glycosylase/DNA-(apurinic or apyrimidinic site) lyase [Candidatus Eremiobacteraceae bacterium]|nr:bifunctional DNA-formamidopyrimidine glycosylase/DNA-(apurinic or apyrimidinic site) lyase [Candidatus Eremiobacteraceae bacterium]